MNKFVVVALLLFSSLVFAQVVTSESEFDQKIKEAMPTVNVEETFANETQPVETRKSGVTDPNANKAENEIPLRLDAAKGNGAPESPWMRFTLALSVVGLLGVGTFIMTKKYATNKGNKSSKGQIQILTQHHLGPKKSLAIVRVAGESILIGISEHNINLIKSLSLIDEEIPEELPSSFKSSLSKSGFDEMILDRDMDSRDRSAAEMEDEFSIGGIRDAVKSKLKGLRG